VVCKGKSLAALQVAGSRVLWSCLQNSISQHPFFISYPYILVFQLVYFLQVFPPKPSIPSLPLRATCLAHLTLLNLKTRTIFGEQYISWSSSVCSFLHFVTSSLLGPNIFLSTLFSDTFTVRDQVSHPRETTGKEILQYMSTFTFFDSRLKDEKFWTEW